MHPRREFLTGLAAAAGVPAFTPAITAAAGLLDHNGGAVSVDQATLDFWTGFLDQRTAPLAAVPERTRGAADAGREPFFFHSGKDGLMPAVDIPTGELVADGDVTVTVNMSAFHASDGDRAAFERFQNAQLRLDVVQDVSLVDVLDTLAWTVVASLSADKQKKLPPIQELAFDPATAWKKVQNIVLPKGQGRWALNLFVQRPDPMWQRILQTSVKVLGRWASVFGFGGISTTGLQSFNQFYGAWNSQPEYLFQSTPVPVVATGGAFKASPTSRVLPLRSGSYLLVPVAHAAELTNARLRNLELKQGLLVPKNTESALVWEAARTTLPNVTYVTLDVLVKPIVVPCQAKTP